MEFQIFEEATTDLAGGIDSQRYEGRLFDRMRPGLDLRDEVQFEATLSTADRLLRRVEGV